MVRLSASVAAVLVCWGAVTEAADCKPSPLGPDALRLIKPLMEVRLKQAEEQFFEDGRWRGESKYTPEVNKRFGALLRNQSRVGDEALAYLLTVYMGEHQGEELVCEVIRRGKRMLPLIHSYKDCTPLTGLEPLHKFVQGSGVLPGNAIDGITKGQTCR